MSSRDKDPTTPHQPLLSSLVVRPTDSGGGGSDYEPGEVRRDPHPYSRSDRFPDNSHGYRMRAGSVSPVHRRNGGHNYSPEYDHSDGSPRNRGFGRGRDSARYRDYSPPYGRGRFGGGRFGGGRFGGGRFGGRFDGGPAMGRGFRGGDGIPRKNPNVRPREGDWMCTDPACNNLNFARRENCNNCNRSRYAPPNNSPPRRNYPGPPLLPRRFPGPPLARSPNRSFNNYHRSPPRNNFNRDYIPAGPPHPRGIPRDHKQPDYFEDELRERNRFEWRRERKVYDNRRMSPPPPPLMGRGGGGGRWVNDERERSRSPMRGPPPPPVGRGRWVNDERERSRSPVVKEYRRDGYVDRGRDERRGMGRDSS